MTEQNPEQTPTPLAGAELELARVRAALAAGLTFEHGVRLQGSTPEELAADASAFASEISAANPVPQGPRAGGDRGSDVGSGGASGTLGAGIAAYRERHGLDADGNRPAPADRPASGTPFRERTYSMNGH